MKKVIATLIFALVTVSASAQFVGPNGEWSANWPVQIGTTYNPTPAMCEAAGWREATAQEIADKAAADQAAAEQAALDATLPATFATGIAVTNEAGHWVEFVPDGTNVVAQTLAIQVSQSPLTPEQREAMKAAALADRAAKLAEAKAAKKNGKLQDRIAALEALLGVDP